MDEYKLDTRVTILFSRAQIETLREIAHEEQTSVSGVVRGLVKNKLETNGHWRFLYKKQLKKGEQND